MITTIRLTERNWEFVKKTDLNLSQYLNNRLEEEDVDFLKKKLIKIEKEKEKMSKFIEKVELERIKFNSIEQKYLRETVQTLETHGEDSLYFKNRFKGFVTKFNKQTLRIQDFKKAVTTFK